MDILKTITAFLLAVLLLSPPTSAFAASGTRAVEHEVKAAYLYNFTKFVTWPTTAFESDSEPLRVCIVEDSDIADAFEILAKKSKGRQIRIVRYRNMVDVSKSHLVYIGDSADDALTKSILSSVGKRPVLTVGDTPAFVRQGGIIGFIASGSKLAFEINPAAAKRNGLEISWKLLNLAKIVRDQP
jgi:hypothetical protein